MADSVEVDSGTGITVATDLVDTTKHAQLVKLAYSAGGVDTHVEADVFGLRVSPVKDGIVVDSTTVGTSQAQISGNGNITAAERISIAIKNFGDDIVYIGPTGVLTTSGFPLNPGDVWFDDVTNIDWYAISGTAGNDVRTVEVGDTDV